MNRNSGFNLPKEYTQKIIQIFGADGEKWVNNIPYILEKYVRQFSLQNIKIVDNPTFNLVFFATSEEFGEVVVKIELPHNELLFREINALNVLNSEKVCKCFYHSIEDGVIVLERLRPGEPLRSTSSRYERINEFCKVANSISVEVGDNCVLPTYKSIYERSLDNCANNYQKYKLLSPHLTYGYIIYNNMLNRADKQYVLHSDLHHDNILSTSEGGKAIDPHGFVGCKVMEYARFIEEEIKNDSNIKESILEVASMISKRSGFSLDELLRALYIDLSLSTSWDVEIGMDEKHIANDVDNLTIIYNLIEQKPRLNKEEMLER